MKSYFAISPHLHVVIATTALGIMALRTARNIATPEGFFRWFTQTLRGYYFSVIFVLLPMPTTVTKCNSQISTYATFFSGLSVKLLMIRMIFTQNKILNSIIILHAVNMVNNFTLKKAPLQVLLNNKSVLQHVALTVCVWMIGTENVNISSRCYNLSTFPSWRHLWMSFSINCKAWPTQPKWYPAFVFAFMNYLTAFMALLHKVNYALDSIYYTITKSEEVFPVVP